MSTEIEETKKKTTVVTKTTSSKPNDASYLGRLASFFFDSLNKFTFFALCFLFISWSSAFIYLTVYYMYVPIVVHNRAVNFQFDSTCDVNCKNPYALVPLSNYKTPTIFSKGQQYLFHINLELPESDVNWNQGMFMVRLKLFDDRDRLVLDTATSSILRYKSPLLRIANLLCYWPLMVIGLKQEQQHISIELANNYIDGIITGRGSATTARVFIEAKQIQVYQAQLVVKADLKGLRYFMVNWPVSSAILGIISVGFLLSMITVCSFYRAVSTKNSYYEDEFAVKEFDKSSSTTDLFNEDFSFPDSTHQD